MTETRSYQRALQSSVVIGSASAITIVIGIVRIKALVILLGPAGVGLAGMLGSILGFCSTLAGLGLSASGVRQLASSGDDPALLARVRQALFVASVFLGCSGGALLWILRKPISALVFGESGQEGNVGWLGVGVLLTLVAASQISLLRGLRRIGDMARVTVISAMVSTAGGVFIVWLLGIKGVIAFVLLAPATGAITGAWFASRLQKEAGRSTLSEMIPEWRAMAALGVAFMATALLAEGTQLFVRAQITTSISLNAVGQFQAAWTVSMQYIGFVLTAMAADYYPRLASIATDKDRANRMVNEQVKLGLLLAGPAMLLVMTLAPQVINLLYSSDFVHSAHVLRWQILGDVIKVATWPMGFILLARAERGWFLFIQLTWNIGFAGMVWLLLPRFGLVVTGYAFFACYCVAFLLNIAIAYRVTGFRISRDNVQLLLTLLAGAVAIMLLFTWIPAYATHIGLALTTMCLAINLRRLLRLYGGVNELPQPISLLLRKLRQRR